MCSSNQIQKFKKMMCFFVVPGNGQARLWMPETAVLNIINLNIDSIQVEITKCKTEDRKHTMWQRAVQTDKGVITKQDANSENDQNNLNKSINYFIHQKIRCRYKEEQCHDTKNPQNIWWCFEWYWVLQRHILITA